MSARIALLSSLFSVLLISLVQVRVLAQRDLDPPVLGPRPPSTYLNAQERESYYSDLSQAQQFAVLPDAKEFIQFDEQMKRKWSTKMFTRYLFLQSALFIMSDSKQKNSKLARYVVNQIDDEGIKVDPFIRILASCQYINYRDINTKEDRDKHTLSTAKYVNELLKQNAAFDESLKRIKQSRLEDIDMLKNEFFVPSVVARLKIDYAQAPFDIKTLSGIVQQLKQSLPQDSGKWDEVQTYVLEQMKLRVEGVQKDPFPSQPAITTDAK